MAWRRRWRRNGAAGLCLALSCLAVGPDRVAGADELDVPLPPERALAPAARPDGTTGSDADETWSPFGLRSLGPDPPLLTEWDSDMPVADRLWLLPVLHRNPDSLLLQEVRLIGRYHGQLGSVSASQGSWERWEARRERLGLVVDFLRQFRARAQVKNSGEDGFVDRDNLEDAWIGWRPAWFPSLTLKAGQFKPLWSYEWGLSSNTMPMVERALFVEQFRPDRAGGVSATLATGNWNWGAAWFSGNIHDGVGNDTGWFSAANVGYDFGDRVGAWEDFEWRLDWVYNSGSDEFARDQRYEHAISTSVVTHLGRWGVAADAMLVTGLPHGHEAFGVSFMPSYELVEKRLQLVGRYHFAAGGGNSLVLRERYERQVVDDDSAIGHRYHSAYAGINWFIYRQKLKVMAGAEYAHMNDRDGAEVFDGWTALAGIRFWF